MVLDCFDVYNIVFIMFIIQTRMTVGFKYGISLYGVMYTCVNVVLVFIVHTLSVYHV